MATALTDASAPTFANLLATCPIVPGANVSKPLLNLPEGKLVLFAMDAGQEISDHHAPFIATVHVLEGRLLFGVAGKDREMGPSDWLVMPPNAPHRLRALEPTRFLLTMLKPRTT